MTKPKHGIPKRYWDACVFLDFIKGSDRDGAGTLRTLGQHAKEGKLLLITSTMTLAEVVRPKRCDGSILDKADREKIKGAFNSPAIALVDVTQVITERAREIQWDVPGIKPIDAIHLATAEQSGADYFDTFDANSITNPLTNATNFSFNSALRVGAPAVDQTEIDFKGGKDD